MSQRWNQDAIPDLSGRTILITGANSGIGYEAARLLAARGAHVLMACRNQARADEAIASIRAAHPAASLEFRQLDVADLSSVERCADGLRRDLDRLDVLVNNAGIMAIPYRKSVDGFELQLATNHLGHFALTQHLLPLMQSAPSRVVAVGSMAHAIGRIRFDDLQSERGYVPSRAYGQSKLANLLFIHELAKRLQAAGSPTIALSAHPGYAATRLTLVAGEMKRSRLQTGFMKIANAVIGFPAEKGALPTVRAVVDESLAPGAFVGPRILGLRGLPAPQKALPKAYDDAAATRLWTLSEELTGTHWPL